MLTSTQNFAGQSSLSDPNDLYLVSDLHLAEGRVPPLGKFARGENFFWDESFGRFLTRIASAPGHRSQTLLVNGDFLDFLRVSRIPNYSNSLDARRVKRWDRFLAAIRHEAAGSDLYKADRTEMVYGFQTEDYKSVWKLLLIMDGHPVFFSALRKFLLKRSNRLVIVKGNHDLEFSWEAVRQAFVYFLAGERRKKYGVLNRHIRFYQDELVLNGECYIEHGHRFDYMARSRREKLRNRPKELDLPPGSLFNRYVINKIENIEPLFDNIKPPTDILMAVALHYPAKLFLIATRHLKGAWRIIKKKQPKFAAAVIGKVAAAVLPVLSFAIVLVAGLIGLRDALEPWFVRWVFIVALGALVGAVVRWTQRRWVAHRRPRSLVDRAIRIRERIPGLRVITFGHTHTSEMRTIGGDCWYINSGTWVPVIDLEVNRVEDTSTFCVLRILHGGRTLHREPLLRWQNNRQALEPMIFFDEENATVRRE